MSDRGTAESRSERNQQNREQTEHPEFLDRFKAHRILDKATQNRRCEQSFGRINRECSEQEPLRNVRRSGDEKTNGKQR